MILKRVPIFLLISLLFLFTRCEDYFDPRGLKSTVYGTVTDTVNDIPFVGLKMLIIESNTNGFYSTEEFIQVLDSTYTDVNGYYELNFTTSGKGDFYSVVAERKDSIWTYFQDPVEVETTDLGTEVDFNFLHLYPAILNIRVAKDVEFLPVGVTYRYHGRNYIFIEETDTVIQERIFIDKNSPQRIKIFRNISLNEWDEFYFIIPATNTTEVAEYDIHVTNADFEDKSN